MPPPMKGSEQPRRALVAPGLDLGRRRAGERGRSVHGGAAVGAVAEAGLDRPAAARAVAGRWHDRSSFGPRLRLLIRFSAESGPDT